MANRSIVLRGPALYNAVRRLSSESKRLWIASPYLGRGARNILDQTFAAGKDKRILVDIKAGGVDKKELQWLRRLPGMRTKSLACLHAKIYIFDSGTIITSANFSLNGFERNEELGLEFTGRDAKPFVNAFTQLWRNGTNITPAQVTHLSGSPKWGPGGPPGKGAGRHTAVDQWAPLKSTKGQSSTSALSTAVPDGAAPTFEAKICLGPTNTGLFAQS